MNGMNVLARALRQCSDRCYAIPGYPITALADEVGAVTTVNEKVALEYALGDSLAGRRAAVVVKHLGLNACADPLVLATTQGLHAGVVMVVGDDIGPLASQNVQDSRYYGEVAQIPVIEPDGETIARAVEEAFEASAAFSRVALLRVTPALLESEAVEVSCKRQNHIGTLADPMLTLRGRAVVADQKTGAMFSWSRSSPLNRFSGGVVGAGPVPGQSRAVTVYPPPADPECLEDVHELGRPFLYEHRSVAPPSVSGEPERMQDRGYYRTFCRECPFHPVLGALREHGARCICDAGCAILATNPPYALGVAGYGLGSAIAVAAASTGYALIGDYALLHSGLNALIDVYEKQLPLLCIVLKNTRMGMTGGQPVPDILKYLAWADPSICDADDTEGFRQVLKAPERPRTVVIEGACPRGGHHETVAY